MSKVLEPSSRYYFVDEAGDGVIFNKRGKVIIGTEGCSRFFMLGLLDTPNPESLQIAFDDLRNEIIKDPWFNKIPSMQPENKKTALFFHAKDDLPEIRREVFKTIMIQRDLRFFAVVRDKQKVLEDIKKSSKRYSPNDLYDKTISRLFVSRLHKDKEYVITFAKRGSADSTKALNDALQIARKRAEEKWNVKTNAPIVIKYEPSYQSVGLQVIDYLLWALQRVYERREDRYINYVWDICHLVHDVDDTRLKPYGVYYSQKNALTLNALKPL